MLRELWADLRYRLRAVFRRARMDDDLDAELLPARRAARIAPVEALRTE